GDLLLQRWGKVFGARAVTDLVSSKAKALAVGKGTESTADYCLACHRWHAVKDDQDSHALTGFLGGEGFSLCPAPPCSSGKCLES
ncbi:MAG TPA: hypothetical protein DIU15_18295, partial [Deltaproteobacteria bacterium]|nr:hypothetical protein [Deltaproteobacteria bacterium]